MFVVKSNWVSLIAQRVKNHLQCRRQQKHHFNPWVEKIPWRRKWQHIPVFWRRKWQPTPVFLPGESHGWRSLVGSSPRGCKELDMTEQQLELDMK